MRDQTYQGIEHAKNISTQQCSLKRAALMLLATGVLTQNLEEEKLKGNPNKILFRTQRAQFVESGDEVLFISIAHELRLRSKMNRCVSFGLRIDNALKRKVKFLNDPQIPVEKVNQTCERCPFDNIQCSEQKAPPSVFI